MTQAVNMQLASFLTYLCDILFVLVDCGIDGSVYFKHTNKCYKLYNEVTLAWYDARWNCREMGRNGDLASISDFATQNFIKGNFNFTSWTWFGGRAKVAKGYWKWVDGSEWLYDNWRSGYPSDRYEREVATVIDASYIWYDQQIAYNIKYWSLCQYQVSTETQNDDTCTRSNSIPNKVVPFVNDINDTDIQ